MLNAIQRYENMVPQHPNTKAHNIIKHNFVRSKMADFLHTGVGICNERQCIRNTTGWTASDLGQIATLSCHSASRDGSIGRWVGPSGHDLATIDGKFSVEQHSGDYPSYVTLSLIPGENRHHTM